MKAAVLRKAFIGYDKGDVLMKLDGINALVGEVNENHVSKSEALAEARQIAATPARIAILGAFRKSDVDRYISQLVEQIAAL